MPLSQLSGLRAFDVHLDGLPVGGVLDLESVEGEVPESAGGGNDPLRAGPDEGDLFLADVCPTYEDGEHRVARDWLDLPARLPEGAADAAAARANAAVQWRRNVIPSGYQPPRMISLEQYRALRDGAGLVNRSVRGRLRLTGADRRDYLQGLLTNDIAALSPGSGCYACLLTAQGRMIADMYVIETGHAILMDLERDVTARVGEHLAQFMFSEDVQVIDVSGSTAQIGIFGPDAAHVVNRAFESHGSAPTTADLESCACSRIAP